MKLFMNKLLNIDVFGFKEIHPIRIRIYSDISHGESPPFKNVNNIKKQHMARKVMQMAAKLTRHSTKLCK